MELKPNIYSLQKDVIHLLNDIEALFDEATIAFDRGDSSEKFKASKEEVNEAKENIRNLELRMAIVAPMKAGKSTIINAIVGQELLPSRNAAMTTLPTEIILSSDIKEAKLTLDNELRLIFQQCFFDLKKTIDYIGLDNVKVSTSKYPHLHPLLDKIVSGSLQLKETVYGKESIVELLSELNDAIRLCNFIIPESDPLNRLTTVPRIQTPFWKQKKTSQDNLLGHLVIIDTPGPNEAGDNLKLSGVVENELKKSSIVLIVLDFTQLNTEAAENIKQDVARVIELRGKDSLYILVNKADQRREGDLTPKEVKEFVVAEFGIDSLKIDEAVFEISARRAFSASSFFKISSSFQDSSLDELKRKKQTRLLAQEVFGIDWEEELEDSDLEELSKKANRLLAKSKFDFFIESSIHALMESAAPRTMRSALNLCRGRLIELKNETSLRSNAASKSTQKLQDEIYRLEEDLEHLEFCRKRLEQVREIKEPLKKYISDTIKVIREDIDFTIRQRFVDKDYARGNILQKLDIKARDFFTTEIFDFEFPLSKALVSGLSYQSKGVLEFTTQEEAEKFAQESISYCRLLVENYLRRLKDLLEDTIQATYINLKNTLETSAQPIVQRATQRISEEFDIELPAFTSPDLKTEAFGHLKFQGTQKFKTVTTTEFQKKRRWFTLFLFKVNTKVKVSKKKSFYEVVLLDLVNQINASLDQSISDITNDIFEYLECDIQTQVDTYFNSLDRYIFGYRESLKNAQSDQHLSLEKREDLKKKLRVIIASSTKKEQKCNQYLARVQQIF